jgi:hypothetical protein
VPAGGAALAVNLDGVALQPLTLPVATAVGGDAIVAMDLFTNGLIIRGWWMHSDVA